MAPTVPRKNTLKFEFDKSTRKMQPNSVEIHDWIVDKFGITTDHTHTAYYDLDEYCFYVKLLNPVQLERLLLQYGDGAEFRHRDGSVSTVQISNAGVDYTNVRIFNLPPEVENCYLKDVLRQYGDIKTIRLERWSNQHKLQCYNGVRSVEIHVKSNIPSYIMVCGYRAQVQYKDQVSTCYICNESGHVRQKCPNRVTILKSTLQQRKKLTLADMVKGSEPLNDLVPEPSVNNIEADSTPNKEFPPLPTVSDPNFSPFKSMVPSVNNKRRKTCDGNSFEEEMQEPEKVQKTETVQPVIDEQISNNTFPEVMTDNQISQPVWSEAVLVSQVVAPLEATPLSGVSQHPCKEVASTVNTDGMVVSECQQSVSTQHQSEHNAAAETGNTQPVLASLYTLCTVESENKQLTGNIHCGNSQEHEQKKEHTEDAVNINLQPTVNPTSIPVETLTSTRRNKKQVQPNLKVPRKKSKSKGRTVNKKASQVLDVRLESTMDWRDSDGPKNLK